LQRRKDAASALFAAAWGAWTGEKAAAGASASARTTDFIIFEAYVQSSE